MSEIPNDKGINQWLIDNYGKSVDGDFPKFRLRWTTGLREKRFGEYTDMAGDIFIRRVKEVRESLKYPYDQDRWVLEVFAPGEYTDLIDKYNYDSLYFFQDRFKTPLPLNHDVIKIYLYFYMHRDKFVTDRQWLTRKNEIEDEMAKKDEQEKEEIRQLMRENESLWHTMDLV